MQHCRQAENCVMTKLVQAVILGVPASEGWWEAWKPSPKVTRSHLWSETKLEDPQVRLGWVSPWNVMFSHQWHC